MAEPAHVAFVKWAQVGDAVFEHRDALDAHAEGEALPLARVDAAVGENLGLDHAAAEDLEPVGAAADLAGFAGPADVDLHGGFGEREVGAAEADREVGDAEEGAEEIDEAAFEMAERDVAAEHQAFALVEHGGVGGVVVGAVGAAGDDDAERELAGEHGADLHRGGVGAQDAAAVGAFGRGDIEGVHVFAGGMVGGDVERAKIAPVVFDVGAFGDREAHGAEDGGHLLHGAGDRVDEALGARLGRERDVDAFGGQAGFEGGFLEFGLARLDGGGELGFQNVQRGAAGFAVFRGGLAEFFEEVGEGTGFAEHADADGIPGAQIGG
eukprot:gene6661-6731_t